MTRILAALLMLTMLLPAQRPTCRVVYGSGKRWCACWIDHRWQPAPRLACRIWK